MNILILQKINKMPAHQFKDVMSSFFYEFFDKNVSIFLSFISSSWIKVSMIISDGL